MTRREMLERRSPLSTRVEGGYLVIRIGLDTLCHAAENCERFFDGENPIGPPYCKVVDTNELARDVRRELEREEEDGSSPLTKLLDDAIEAARDDGCLAFQDQVLT